MSASLETIEEYFRILEAAVTSEPDDPATAVAMERRIKANYAAALRDLEWNHQERLKWRAAYYVLGGKPEDRDVLIEGVDLR